MPAFAQSPQASQVGPDQAASGSSAVPPDQQATKEQIEKFFEVARMHKQLDQMLNMLPEIIAQSFRDQMKSVNDQLPPGKRLMPEDQAALQKVMNKYMQQALTIYSVDEMIADAVPVYQRHLSKSDADAVIAFYRSSAGQRLLDEQPAILQEYMPIVTSHMQERSKRLTDEMNAEIRQIVKPEFADPKSPAKPE
ncbi:MAG TPA: DUF2059 domain-containing protein [Terracidiphilus sp.]|nr:DUF2059 domain-containing protein [Terracidiphilus sp.]